MNYLLAGIWMSLAWSLRGQFGHLKGALIPGAFAALLIALSAPHEKWRRAFPFAVILGSFIFGEPLTIALAIGGGVTLFGLYLVNFSMRKNRNKINPNL